jgi:Fn3 associated
MPDNHSTQYTGPAELPDEPFTIRVIAYRNGLPISHLTTLDREELKKRDKNWDD